ncbi:LysR family transcriptional regulator [Bradyrhizobium cenepequi]|jgi:DNA-binding transcriptional LysR family regulator
MDLNSLQTFVAVVRAGGFAAAARQTNTPRSSVSLRIRTLERTLGVRLFKRSTRAFSLTTEGAELYGRSAEALASLIGALAGLGKAGASYVGGIRLTAPADFPPGIIAGAISEFRETHPAVRFEVLLTNDVLDLISENIDVALRIGASNPQEALVRGVLDMEFGLYASAEYLRRNGVPASIHAVSTLIGPERPELRRLLSRALKNGVEFPQFQLAVDSFVLVREFVLRHQGVGLLPESLCRAELASKAVVPVLPNLFSGSTRLHLTFPSRADLNPKVNAFAQVLARHLEAAAAGR